MQWVHKPASSCSLYSVSSSIPSLRIQMLDSSISQYPPRGRHATDVLRNGIAKVNLIPVSVKGSQALVQAQLFIIPVSMPKDCS